MKHDQLWIMQCMCRLRSNIIYTLSKILNYKRISNSVILARSNKIIVFAIIHDTNVGLIAVPHFKSIENIFCCVLWLHHFYS